MRLVSRDKPKVDASGSVSDMGNVFDYEYYDSHKNDKSSDDFYRRKQKALVKMVKRAIEENLTERQKQIYIAVKIYGQPQKEVACDLGLNPSTITRTIQSAQKKLNKVLGYFDDCKDLFVDEWGGG